MKRFAELFEALDQTTSTNAKVEELVDYFAQTDPSDAAWGVFFLAGQRMKRLVGSRKLREWLTLESSLPEWLVEESYAVVGDIAETVALLLENDRGPSGELPLHRWMEERIIPLRQLDEAEQQQHVIRWWRELPTRQILIVNKLLTGGFRVGVSKTLVVRALSRVAELDTSVIQHRLMGAWSPTAEEYLRLIAPETEDVDHSRPYPFFLASPLEAEVERLGARDDWCAEWKWDGIRSQLIARGGEVFLWSRGEELITERFPEIAAAGVLPEGCVLDGEVLAFNEGPLPFSELQRRIGRRKPSPSLREQVPVVFMAYDIMEHDGEDVRGLAMRERRKQLETVVSKRRGFANLRLSPLLEDRDWGALKERREKARSNGVEGLILKRWDSTYGSGRKRGPWWKWKVEPFTIDAVLIYAQAGHGKRANLYTDYTFAVWKGDELTPVAKAYSGLNNDEIQRLDRWIRKHTREKFGPVRSVEPFHVFEIAFEGLQESKRHKSGLALRFPRIARWREDKSVRDADTLQQVRAFLDADK